MRTHSWTHKAATEQLDKAEGRVRLTPRYCLAVRQDEVFYLHLRYSILATHLLLLDAPFRPVEGGMLCMSRLPYEVYLFPDPPCELEY